MFSEQEQFRKEAIEKLYGFADSDYVLYSAYGRNARPDLISYVALSRQMCGKGENDFSAILNLVEKYCCCDSQSIQSSDIEEKLFKAIVDALDEYVVASEKHLDSLKDKTKRLFSDISEQDKRDIDVRKNDIRYIITQTNESTMLGIACCLKMYFDSLMYGLLPAEPLSETEESVFEGFTAKEVPLFTHEPVCTDIPQDKTGPFFDGLRTLAETDALFIKNMFRDCSNGKVYVRLYNPGNDFAPEYIAVEKHDAINQWVMNGGGSCNWPGYIIAALNTVTLNVDSHPEDLFSFILGDKINETDLSDFCIFSESKIVIPEETTEFKIKSAYKHCGLALYATLLTTNSNMIEDSEPYLNLIDAITEFIPCFSFSTAGKQTRDAAMNLLKQHSDSYRIQAITDEMRTKKRILVCDAIDTMFELYSLKPDANPLEVLRANYPQLKL